MITKKELWRFRQAGVEIEGLKMQIQELTATLDGLTAQQITDMPKGGNVPHSAIEDAIIRLESLRELYASKIGAWYTRQGEIEVAMSCLEPKEAAVIRSYYFRRAPSWETVAAEVDNDLRSVYRIHGKALEKMRRS